MRKTRFSVKHAIRRKPPLREATRCIWGNIENDCPQIKNGCLVGRLVVASGGYGKSYLVARCSTFRNFSPPRVEVRKPRKNFLLWWLRVVLLRRPFQRRPQSLATKSGSSRFKKFFFLPVASVTVTSLLTLLPTAMPPRQKWKFGNQKSLFRLAASGCFASLPISPPTPEALHHKGKIRDRQRLISFDGSG